MLLSLKLACQNHLFLLFPRENGLFLLGRLFTSCKLEGQLCTLEPCLTSAALKDHAYRKMLVEYWITTAAV